MFQCFFFFLSSGLLVRSLLINAHRILGLYSGLFPNLVGVTPEKAIKLVVNDQVSFRSYVCFCVMCMLGEGNERCADVSVWELVVTEGS